MTIPSFTCTPVKVEFHGNDLPSVIFHVACVGHADKVVHVPITRQDLANPNLTFQALMSQCAARAVHDHPASIARRAEIDEQSEGTPGAIIEFNV